METTKTYKEGWKAGFAARDTDIKLAIREVLLMVETPRLAVKSWDVDAVLETFLAIVNKNVKQN